MQISGGILFAAAAAVAAAGAALRLGGLALGLDACFIGMERALGDVAESGDASGILSGCFLADIG